VKTGWRKSGQPAIASDILDYLVEHTQAQDTLEGIVQWWLMEQRIKQAISDVKSALDELVREGLVLEHEGADGQARYSINLEKIAQIRARLKQGKRRPRKRPPG
jgi:Fe2+ or Zn2+ uptake regulation protein